MQVDDTRPIWIQLVDAFRHRIVSGQWEPGSKIPSVRELASGARAGSIGLSDRRARAGRGSEHSTIGLPTGRTAPRIPTPVEPAGRVRAFRTHRV